MQVVFRKQGSHFWQEKWEFQLWPKEKLFGSRFLYMMHYRMRSIILWFHVTLNKICWISIYAKIIMGQTTPTLTISTGYFLIIWILKRRYTHISILGWHYRHRIPKIVFLEKQKWISHTCTCIYMNSNWQNNFSCETLSFNGLLLVYGNSVIPK